MFQKSTTKSKKVRWDWKGFRYQCLEKILFYDTDLLFSVIIKLVSFSMILGNWPFVVGLSLINFCPMFPFYSPCILQFLKNILLELNTSITIFYSKNQNGVHWGINLPQKHHPPLFHQAPLPQLWKLSKSSLFSQFPLPLYIGFSWTSIGFFSEPS